MARIDVISPSKQQNLLAGTTAVGDHFYAGPGENPYLREFCRKHRATNPYEDALDSYHIPPFDKPIETSKATAIYNMHPYWSKKPHDAIRAYIRHYTKQGDLVLDPFAGSGGTAVSAMAEARKAIAIDIDPSATHICAGSVVIVDPNDFLAEVERILVELGDIERTLYGTECPTCHGPATITSVTYAETYRCDKCWEYVAVWKLEASGRKRGKSDLLLCPSCRNEIYVGGDRQGTVPVQFYTRCEGGCRRKAGLLENGDPGFVTYAAGNDAVQQLSIGHWYPQTEFPDGLETLKRKRFKQIGFRTVDTLFTRRNLHALSALWATFGASPFKDLLRFAFTGCVLNTSKLYRFREDGGGGPTGNYYVPPVNRELNVFDCFRRKAEDIARAKTDWSQLAAGGDLVISTQSCLDLSAIPDNTVDYIFTDPPYGDVYQYRELNAVWNAWLTDDASPSAEDVVVNEYQHKDVAEWRRLMTAAFKECCRVLKPGRALSLCFHHTDASMWQVVQDLMAEAGFIVEKTEHATTIGTDQLSFYQRVLHNTNKRDMVISFRKPKGVGLPAATIQGDEDSGTFKSKVVAIISEFLSANPGPTKDRIYDHVVSCMVRAGTMEAHNFDEVLAELAEPVHEPVRKNLFEDKEPDLFGTHEVIRWYLKATELDVVDAAESAKEDGAAESLRSFIQKKLESEPWADGVHYSDLFEQFIYTVRDKPRRPMVEWLTDYFFKTESGTYRLAKTEEEVRLKAEGRSKGTSRRIKRYLAFLEQGLAVPPNEHPSDATLADWIRHAKLAGMFDAGKVLFERGGLRLDRLDEEAAVNVEEDYQVCVRMLSRQEKA